MAEGAAAVAGTTGAVILGGHVVYGATTAAMPYAYTAGAAVETTIASAEAAAPITTAVVRGLVETAAECQFAGNCNWTDYAWGAVTAGLAPVSAKRAGCDRSFDEDTLVTTDEGLVPISEIEEGDYVLAYNEETGEVGYYPVTETWVHEDPVLTYLVIEGEFIATTPTHLFYTTEGWVEAGELGEDAYVVRAGGVPGQVWESLTFALPRLMYDLTVAEAHTFFVGEEQWLVHNNCGMYDVGPVNELRADSTAYDGLDIHHVPQAHPASQVVPNYNSRTAPGIALPEAMHENIPTMRGPYTGSPRDLLAQNLWELREAGVPNGPLLELLSLNRKLYPGVFD